MLRVGLTGGIASGKSHVLRRLAAGGCHTLDLDQASREVMAPGGSAYGDVLAAFGREFLGPDGSIDRKALGRRVFGDPAARARLDALVHPRVREVEERFAHAHAGALDIVVVDGALLVESGWHGRFDRLIVVYCAPEQQLQRLMARDGLDLDAARVRIAAQMPVAEKRLHADFEIDSSGSPAETDARTDRVLEELRLLISSGRPS